MSHSMGCRTSVLVELLNPPHPGKNLCVPDPGAPRSTDEAASSLAHCNNKAVVTEKVTSASRPQRITTLTPFPGWYSRNAALLRRKQWLVEMYHLSVLQLPQMCCLVTLRDSLQRPGRIACAVCLVRHQPQNPPVVLT